jgi:hypothetical protein
VKNMALSGTLLALDDSRRKDPMEKPGNPLSSWELAPHPAGRRPHLSLLLAVPVLAAACATTDANQVTQPSVLGMTDQMPPYYSDGQLTLYQVQVPVTMPMRAPNGTLPTASDPAFPNPPFITIDDVKSEIRYTITNLDNTKHTIELLIDPWNEFVRYKPGIQIVSDEQTTPDLSGRDKLMVLDPLQRIQGTFTSDDTREVAIDLATVMELQACYITMSGCTSTATIDPMASVNGLFNHAFNVQNNSTGYDPLLAPFRLKLVPALIGFDLGLRSDSPENIAVEVQVDVTDTSSAGNRVLTPGSTDQTAMPMPTTILAPPKVKAM